ASSSASTWASCLLSAGWVMPSTRAARPKCSCSASTMADTHGAELAWLSARRGAPVRRELPLEELASPEERAALEATMQEGSFFGDLAVMPDSQRVMAALAERYPSSTTIPGISAGFAARAS